MGFELGAKYRSIILVPFYCLTDELCIKPVILTSANPLGRFFTTEGAVIDPAAKY